MKEFIITRTPVWFQNLAITMYNCLQYRIRRGGAYSAKRQYFKEVEMMSFSEIELAQSLRLKKFLEFSCTKSDWYKRDSLNIKLLDFDVLEKSQLLKNFCRIVTISESEAVISLTGGTTGASMKVYYTKEDTQERHALLDHFRETYGYSLGEKVAWFSGKSLVSRKDLARGICYRDDWINNIRFFSTFHITNKYFDSYWKAFNDFAPEFIVGFPSSVFDICMMAKQRGLKYHGSVKFFFPTAETIFPIQREVIGEVLGCSLVDQYASSEGAPFILECKAGSKHIHPLSGIFEVVDENMQPTREGEILVTSFTTHGTPLIRYRIGDRVKLSEPGIQCSCGSVFPLVEFIDGRSSDYVLSSEHGRVNLGNISNCTKNVEGIVSFQVEQNSLDKLSIKVVSGPAFDSKQEQNFVLALTERVGNAMKIHVKRVDEIPREKSGKFRIVKNNLPNI